MSAVLYWRMSPIIILLAAAVFETGLCKALVPFIFACHAKKCIFENISLSLGMLSSSAAFPNRGTPGTSGCAASLQAGKQNGHQVPAFLITEALAGSEEGGLLFLLGLFSLGQPLWRAEIPLVPAIPGGRKELIMLLWPCTRSVMNTSLSVLLFGQKMSGDCRLRPNDTYNWWIQQLKEDMITERRITPCAFLRLITTDTKVLLLHSNLLKSIYRDAAWWSDPRSSTFSLSLSQISGFKKNLWPGKCQ